MGAVWSPGKPLGTPREQNASGKEQLNGHLAARKVVLNIEKSYLMLLLILFYFIS